MSTTVTPSKVAEPVAPVWADRLHWPAVVLLLLAAVLKLHQLMTAPWLGQLVFESQALTAIVIAAEIGLAFWLISKWHPRFARVAAIGLFSVFGVVAAVKHFSGHTSCGCFGVFEVPPLVTLLVDMGMIILLALWPARVERSISLPLAFIATVAVIGVLVPVLTLRASSLSEVGTVVGDGELVVIEPENWIGKRLPLAPYIEGSQEFMTGRWRMVLYREDCPHCQELIEETLSGQVNEPVIFVEVPPYGNSLRQDGEGVLWRRLSEIHDWFVESPSELELEDGIVVAIGGKKVITVGKLDEMA